MASSHTIIVALGSNFEQEESFKNATLLLDRFLPSLVFSPRIWTNPIGVHSDKFLNCLAKGSTLLEEHVLLHILKGIEHECGDSPERRAQGRVKMDLDLLVYAGEKRHIKDWEREYIKQLMQCFD